MASEVSTTSPAFVPGDWVNVDQFFSATNAVRGRKPPWRVVEQPAIRVAVISKMINGRAKPALVLRTDVANVYGSQLPRALFSRMIDAPVEQALRLDAACVVVNLFRIPEQPEVTDQCLQNILKLKPECDRLGMPLMIEPLV